MEGWSLPGRKRAQTVDHATQKTDLNGCRVAGPSQVSTAEVQGLEGGKVLGLGQEWG